MTTEHKALAAAMRLVKSRMEYDHVVYPRDRFRLRKTERNKWLARVLIHLERDARAIIMGR
jgi:hypothetical protein